MPLFLRLPFDIFEKSGRLVLWEIIFILELQFAETQGFHNKINQRQMRRTNLWLTSADSFFFCAQIYQFFDILPHNKYYVVFQGERGKTLFIMCQNRLTKLGGGSVKC